jgi:hypothetical protein
MDVPLVSILFSRRSMVGKRKDVFCLLRRAAGIVKIAENVVLMLDFRVADIRSYAPLFGPKTKTFDVSIRLSLVPYPGMPYLHSLTDFFVTAHPVPGLQHARYLICSEGDS